MWHKVWATVQFDFARSLRLSRLAIIVILAAFPPVISFIAVGAGTAESAPVVIGVTVMLVGVLSLLLWATPVVYQEMEGKTWTYVSVRPHGKIALLFGKYLMSVAWTVLMSWIALSVSVVATSPWVPIVTLARIWGVYSILIVLGAFAYAAIFLVFGVVFHRRSMVLAVAYVVVMEFGVGFIPAMVNKITVLHHLSGLAIKWLDVRDLFPEDVLIQLGVNESVYQHLGMLIIAPMIVLAGTVYLIRTREYITADEN